ncbi:Uncharacterised protein [Legionella pneumophila]|nr:Uncharacterised protein [Legionella pneumophila]
MKKTNNKSQANDNNGKISVIFGLFKKHRDRITKEKPDMFSYYFRPCGKLLFHNAAPL